jgi:glyoxylase-like metal-dependent hydrolase (beta-lactamase superfamily II)
MICCRCRSERLAGGPLKEIYPSLFLILPARQEPKVQWTYFMRRPAGNILFATKADIPDAEPDIEAAGGVSLILLGDRHHATPATVTMARRLGAPIMASRIEATALKKHGIEIDTPLPYQPCQLAPDLEIIPTPGHTTGAFSYLWTNGERRFLFIGDTIVPVDGSWQYWVSPPSRPEMRRTIEKLAALRFDVILSNSFAATPTGWLETPPPYRKAMFADLSRSLSQ